MRAWEGLNKYSIKYIRPAQDCLFVTFTIQFAFCSRREKMILPEDYSKYTVVADCLRKPRETPMAFYNEDEPKTESHVFDFITACVVTLSLLIAGIYIIVS